MDHISNLITSIRNAELVGHSKLTVPNTKLSVAVLAVLKESGYISNFTEQAETEHPRLQIELPQPVTRHTYKRVSKPGRRLFTGADEIPTVLRGLGIVVLSTPQGVMTGKKARKLRLGGEVLFEAY